MATAMLFATEYQGEATPHGHGFISLANMYQHSTLEQIGNMIEKNAKGISPEDMLERITRFCEHLQREDHYDHEKHEKNLNSLEKQFHANNEGPPENVYLSTRSAPLYKPENTCSLWQADGVTDDLLRIAEEGAEHFKRRFEADVQFVFSHVQHHWHILDDKGNRVPLQYCRVKSRKKQCTCKQGFPKKVIQLKNGKVKEEKYRVRVVCQGVAAEMGLKTSGRRNALGSILSRRRCEWFSGTSSILAAVSRSNTNVQCNYRVPLSPTTHDKDCQATQCTTNISARRLCLIAQRAMKQMTGYFGGYISKRQKMGRFEIKKSIAALPLLREDLQKKQHKRASIQLALVTNRMFTALESKGILRVCTEEFMLSSQYKPHDPLAAECIRTFRETNFHQSNFKWLSKTTDLTQNNAKRDLKHHDE